MYVPPFAPSQSDVILNYIISTATMALMLIAYGCKPDAIQRRLQKPAWPIAAGLGASIATLASLMANSVIAVALTGAFTSVLAARFAFMLAQIKPKEILLIALLQQIFAGFVYGYVLYLPFAWRPIFLCLLPLMAGACSALDGGRLRYDSVGLLDIKELPHAKKMMGNLVRLIIAIGLFAATINIVRGFYPSMIEMDTFAEARGSSSILFFFVKVMLCLVVAGLPLNTNLARLSYWCFLILAFCTLPLPLLGLGSSLTLQSFGCINALQNVVIWTLLCSIAYKSGRSPIRIFGWGWGSMALCSVLGWAAGTALVNLGTNPDMMLTVEIVMLAIMLISGIVIINQQVIEALFIPIDRDAPASVRISLNGSRESNQRLETELVESSPSPVSAVENRGRWGRAVQSMAYDHALSDRERDVLKLLLKGYTKNRVAEELCISYNTVRSHVRNIYVKCDAHNQQELIDSFDAYMREQARRNV